jgi:hypothetical protein
MKLEYEIALPEFMEMAWLRHRSSMRWIIGMSIGVIGILLGTAFYIYADHGLGSVLFALSILLLFMQFVVPSLVFRRVYRRNSRMFGTRTVIIDETGIRSDHPLGHTEAAWDTYQKFGETRRSFLLYQSPDLIGILPKRVFADPADLEHFKALITSKIGPSA